jgi:hypothetical protein
MKKLDKAGFFLFDQSEKLKDNFALLCLDEQAKIKGLTGDDARKFIQKKFTQYAIKYGKGQDIGLYGNDYVKTLAQFGQYKIKDLVILADKLPSLKKGGDAGDRSYLIKYAVLSALKMMLFKLAIDQTGFGNSTGTPIDFLNDIVSKGGVNSPIISLAIALYKAYDMPENETEYDRYRKEEDVKRSVATIAIPGSNQLYFKTFKYLDAQNKGYWETFNKKKVANEVSDDLWSKTKGTFFGSSYDPKRQEYFKGQEEKKYYALSETDSKVYKSLDKEKRTEFYDKKKAEKENYYDTQKQITNIKEPKTGFLDKFRKKEEVKPITNFEGMTPEEKKNWRSVVKAKIDSVPDSLTSQEIKEYYFSKGDGNTKVIGDKKKAYSAVKSVMENEDYSDEFKSMVLKESGIKEDDYSFYQFADKDYNDKRETFYTILDQEKRETALEVLAYMRKSVAGKSGLSSEDANYLYDMGVISKEEKALLQNIKYDEKFGKYYLDRDYKPSGSSGTGAYLNGKQLTATQLKQFIKILFDSIDLTRNNKKTGYALDKVLNKKIETPKSKTIDEILAYRT